VSNLLFLPSGFLITGCNLFFILVNPYLARQDDVILVLDTSDILLSFLLSEGVFMSADGDGVRLSSIISMRSLFLSKDVMTLKSELCFFLSDDESFNFCFLLRLLSAIILKPTSCNVLYLFLPINSLLLRMPLASCPLLSYLFSSCTF